MTCIDAILWNKVHYIYVFAILQTKRMPVHPERGGLILFLIPGSISKQQYVVHSSSEHLRELGNSMW